MKVLLVATRMDALGGGAATSARQVAAGLQRQGVDVVTVGTRREPGLVVDEQDGIRRYTFRPRNLYWIGDKDTKPAYQKAGFQLLDLWNPHVYRVIRAIIERERPDIVHVHKLRGLSPSVWAAANHAGRAGLRLIHTCHDHELISPEGTLSGRLGALAVNGSRWLWPYQATRRAQSRAVAAVTAPSGFTLRHHTALGFFREARAAIVPNSHGLSPGELDRLRAELEGQPPAHQTADLRLLYLGRLDTIKGIAVLCAAFEKVIARRPGLRLDVAGEGVLREALKTRYAHLPQIRFHGQVLGEQKRRLLSEADALVVPSVGQEVFGIVIIEAFAHGKPVLATAVGGIPEVIEEGQTGFLVEAGNIEQLAERIVWAGENVGALRAMRPACFAAARAYTLETVTAAYLGVYESVRPVVAPVALPLAK